MKIQRIANDKKIHYRNHNITEVKRDYDDRGNEIYTEINGFEEWKQYNENNDITYIKNSSGFEVWKEYDYNNNLIHMKDTNGYEVYFEYDELNNLINTIEK